MPCVLGRGIWWVRMYWGQEVGMVTVLDPSYHMTIDRFNISELWFPHLKGEYNQCVVRIK